MDGAKSLAGAIGRFWKWLANIMSDDRVEQAQAEASKNQKYGGGAGAGDAGSGGF